MQEQIRIFRKSRMVRQLYKRKPLESGHQGFTTEPDGHEEVFYETWVDVSGLDHMAERAAGNKSQKSRDGALIVKVLERRKL